MRLPLHFTLARNSLSHVNDFEVGWISANDLKMNNPTYPITELSALKRTLTGYSSLYSERRKEKILSQAGRNDLFGNFLN